MLISFPSQVKVRPLRDINYGIEYDAGNTFDTQIKEPRVQTRLCYVGGIRLTANGQQSIFG